MLCGAGPTGLVAFLTSGGVRVLMVGRAAVVVTVWAYYGHRVERRASAQR
ncbi:hypothetical protein ACWZEH_00685 [Streptomyces sp. QTS137]